MRITEMRKMVACMPFADNAAGIPQSMKLMSALIDVVEEIKQLPSCTLNGVTGRKVEDALKRLEDLVV